MPYNQTMPSNEIDCHIYSLFIGNKEDHMLEKSLQQLYSWYTHQNFPTVISGTPVGIITVIHVNVNHHYYDSRHDFKRPFGIMSIIHITVNQVIFPDMILTHQLAS